MFVNYHKVNPGFIILSGSCADLNFATLNLKLYKSCKNEYFRSEKSVLYTNTVC